MTTPAPLLITDELDAIRAEGREIVPGSLIWLPHPTKPGRMVPAVETRVRVETITVAKEGIEL